MKIREREAKSILAKAQIYDYALPFPCPEQERHAPAADALYLKHSRVTGALPLDPAVSVVEPNSGEDSPETSKVHSFKEHDPENLRAPAS